MSVLKVIITLFVIIILLIVGPWWFFRSPEFRHFRRLQYPQTDVYAKSLPIERRLDLHKEVQAWSGHNPIDVVTSDFGDQPAQTYAILVRRLKAGDRSIYYADVLSAIDGEKGFRVCDQPDRKIVQSYLAAVSPDPGSSAFRRLYTC